MTLVLTGLGLFLAMCIIGFLVAARLGSQMREGFAEVKAEITHALELNAVERDINRTFHEAMVDAARDALTELRGIRADFLRRRVSDPQS